MDTSQRNLHAHKEWTDEKDAALERVAAAVRDVEQSDTPASRDQLSGAIVAARDAGVGWTSIGNLLGIASGNAYRRYRKLC